MTAKEKKARIKRIIKQRESLLERAKEHRIKAETLKGKKDTTPAYWLGEAERFEEQAKEKFEILEKLDGKKAKEKNTSREAKTTDTSREGEKEESAER